MTCLQKVSPGIRLPLESGGERHLLPPHPRPMQDRLSSIDVHTLSITFVEKRKTDLAIHIYELISNLLLDGPHDSPLLRHPAQLMLTARTADLSNDSEDLFPQGPSVELLTYDWSPLSPYVVGIPHMDLDVKD